jgi:transposase
MIVGCAPIRQNKQVWNSKASARASCTDSSLLQIRSGVSVSYYQQKAELPGIKEAMPEYGAVNAQVLQDVVQRVDRAFQAFFRRVKSGVTPGYPRFHGRDRYNSVPYPQVGEHGGTVLDGGLLSLSKSGTNPHSVAPPVGRHT